MSDEDILYELKDLYQWRLDREPQENARDSEFTARLLKKLDIRKLLPERNTDILDYYKSKSSWQFTVPNKDRTLLAVLQDNFLEIRHKRDDYQKPIGRTTVPSDANPKWRKIVWSSDGVYIALATSSGELRCYNTLANLICCIPKVDNTHDSISVIPSGAIAALFMLDVRTKSAEWPYEMLVIDFYGNLRSYFVSSTQGYEPYHTFSFGECLLTAAVYVPSFNILILSFPITTLSPKSSDDTLGLSSWRLLIDHPYYRIVKPSIKNLYLPNERKWFSFLLSKNKRTVVLKMSISIDVKFLACLHSCGSVSLWLLPQLTMYRMLHLPDLKKEKSQIENNRAHFISDIGWCMDKKLAVVRNDGILTVSTIDNLDNLLTQINPKHHTVDRQPVLLNTSAALANFCYINTGFLILDCVCKELPSWRRETEVYNRRPGAEQENENSTSDALEVHDSHSLFRQILKFFIYFELFQQQRKQRYTERTYRLCLLKNVTPVELYEQQINREEYEEALDFARLFRLDENRVYKKQWLNSCPVTIESIEKYLLKVTDKKWIICQCCERIPETLQAAQVLLKKGLEYTDFNEFILDDQLPELEDGDFCELKDRKSFELNTEKTTTHFSKNQLHIFELRKYLLSYWDALSIYEKIIELDPQNTPYDPELYRKFRTESPLSLALYFARSGNAEAVHVLFEYYNEELLPYWLEVLNNIPECESPCSYKKLLPAFNEQNKLELLQCKRIRPAEWSESGDFKNFITSVTCEKYLGKELPVPLSKKDITNWYKKKIRKIVDESGLIDYALELLNLAYENNISGLESLRHNLLVLDKLTYDLQMEEEFSLTDVEKRNEFEKLMLLMSQSNTIEQFRNDISEILLPFLNRCETLKPNSRDSILEAYLKKLSQDDLTLPLTFFEYIFETDKNHTLFSAKRKLELRLLCIYEYKRSDQTDIAFKIIKFESELSDNNNSCIEEIFDLKSRLTELHTELVIMQILRTYGIEKSIHFLHTNKNNVQFQKEVLTSMVNVKVGVDCLSKQDIDELFDDLVYIQKNYFYSLPRQTYLRIFAYTVLTLGRVDCIEEYAPLVLRCSRTSNTSFERDDVLSYDESISVIVEAAQYYLNIATSYEDPNISLAKSCLSLVFFHPDVERERKLIDALKDINSFGVQISPLKVRLCVNKMKIVEKILKAKPKSFKKVDKLLSLAKNLHANENEEVLETEVLNLIIDTAFQFKDYIWCSTMIMKLTENNKSCWRMCKKLCTCDEYHDLGVKQKLIKFALIQCPDTELQDLIKLRNEIECKILQKRLQNSLQAPFESTDENMPHSGFEFGIKKPSSYQEDLPNEVHTISTECNEGLISIPALMNMLHTSSMQVLKVNFWKNTFKFRMDEGDEEMDSNLNVECRKLGFPEFYTDLHDEHEDCICLADWKSVPYEMEIFRSLLRYFLLRSRNTDAVDSAVQTDINDVIARLSVTSYPNDCLLCLSLLLLYKDAEYSEKVLSSLPCTISVEKFALYYYSLKFLISCNVAVYDLIVEDSPSTLVSEAISASEKSDSPYVELIHKYKRAIEKRRSVTKLHDLGCGIDSVRFFADETYKVDSVLGLAMYESRDKLDLALSLGVEYGVSSEDIVISHVKSLFLSRNLKLLTERLKESIVINTMKQKPTYCTERIISEIYDGLFGFDYPILLIYYALLNQIAENEVFHHMKPKDHMKLLRKLKLFSKTIDYKLLTSERLQVVEAVLPAVIADELEHVISLLTSLPENLMEKINIDDVFEQLAQKIFFNGPADLSHLKRFELCVPFLERLNDTRISRVVQKYLFSKYSCENIDSSTRRTILDLTKQFLLKHSKGQESELITKLDMYLMQFIKIDEFNEICRSLDINEFYLRELETPIILNDQTELKEIIIRMILDVNVSTEVIKVILEFVRMDCLTDIITNMLNNHLERGNIGSLIYRIENCLEDNEYEKCWSKSLVSVLEQKLVDENLKTRIEQILSLLGNPDDEIYSAIELLHETRLIMREWTSVHCRIMLFDVATEEARLTLIKKLLEQAFALVHFTSLCKVLKFWPSFVESQHWSNNPWFLLLERLLTLYEGEPIHEEELKLLQKIMAYANPSTEVRKTFFNHIGNVPHNEILLVWFCALTNDELLIQSVDSYIAELREVRKMPKLVDEYLKRKQIYK